MKTEQKQWTAEGGWQDIKGAGLNGSADLVFVFGSRKLLEDSSKYDEVRSFYPSANILMGSTSGEIMEDLVYDDSLAVTAVDFEKTTIKVASLNINDAKDSFDAGVKMAEELSGEGLAHVFLLTDGLHVNGSEIVKGINSKLENEVPCTGGLAGDAANFEKTLVGLNAAPSENQVVAIGFYGDSLEVGYGSVGGWDNFGAERLVTRSEGNVLYELDGQSALDLYKMYLGDKAAELPGSALLFPLGLKFDEDSDTIVRTVLAVDEESNSMTFAGDIPEGCYVRLMKADFDKLIEGANLAAEHTTQKGGDDAEKLAILISCVGRKLILGQRIDEEVEGVQEVLGTGATLTGFYSYGEISPVVESSRCELHNQTMTITTFAEK
ncbi:MAG: FIST C-terminal domain-containing protein [Flavobacteriales bacterium]|nr:FIST C-terminal domain-containing protein [Flavobacteriales bacterium]MCB9203924.1 FIST C-terminal domain-containing protein [Flavobacteriales bacterium]